MPSAGSDDKINTIYTELDALDKIEQTSQVDAQRRELIADAIDIHEEWNEYGDDDADYCQVCVHGVTETVKKSKKKNSVSGYEGVSPECSEYKNHLRNNKERRAAGLLPLPHPKDTYRWKICPLGGGGTMICGLMFSSPEEAAIKYKELCISNGLPW